MKFIYFKSISNQQEMSEDLKNMKLTELKEKCRERKLPVSGTKAELIARLNGEPKKTSSENKKTSGKPKNSQKITLQKPVLRSIEKTPIIIKRNIHNNFEHLETHLIFNQNKKVIGHQLQDGTVRTLNINDIENIHRFHFELDPQAKVQDEISENIGETDTDKEKRIYELIDKMEV